ncbi:dihydrofolate reductase family protein [Candidatus Woesearchaeota archaeon]|nr:dihydrofolate reductase family protein [Candidatus Woesearchaeota archaeon]
MDKPYVTIVSEVTVDGKLTFDKGVSSRLLMADMDHESEVFLHQLRADYDAIMVGSTTIKVDNSSLTVRHVEGENPLRVIPCSDASLPLGSAVFDGKAPTVIAISKKAPADKVERMNALDNVEVVEFDRDGYVDYVKLMDYLYNEKGVKRLILEGGGTLNYYMIDAGLVDHIIIIGMALIVGGYTAPPLVGGPGAKTLDETIKLKLTDHRMCGKHLLTEYDIVK